MCRFTVVGFGLRRPTIEAAPETTGVDGQVLGVAPDKYVLYIFVLLPLANASNSFMSVLYMLPK